MNTDATDALALAQRLDCYTAGNRHALAVVRVPTPAEEQKRVASRQRQPLKNEERRLAAQGSSLLLSQGRRTRGAWWPPRRWTALSAQLPEWLRRALEPLRAVLLAVAEQRRAATVALARQLAIDLWRWRTGRAAPEALGWQMNG